MSAKLGVQFFFFNDTATTEIYTLSLHDALPISWARPGPRRTCRSRRAPSSASAKAGPIPRTRDRKSTRLNSSHLVISYAVFCLKKKKDVGLTFDLAHHTLQRPAGRPCAERVHDL